MSKSVHFYISTGAKNARYTLRKQEISSRTYGESNFAFGGDYYITNLADNEELAASKAQEHFTRLAPILEEQGFTCTLSTVPEEIRCARIGKLSAEVTKQIGLVESGFFPFGKMAGLPIRDAKDSHILWWAEQNQHQNIVARALSAACDGVALERDLYGKRELKRAEKAARDALSAYVGEVKQRLTFDDLIIVGIFEYFDDIYRQFGNIVTMKQGDNYIVYKGSCVLGRKGDTITVSASVKAHEEYKGVKQTKLARPKVLKTVSVDDIPEIIADAA